MYHGGEIELALYLSMHHSASNILITVYALANVAYAYRDVNRKIQ